MTILIFLLAFFALYAALAGAMCWHLHVYAFSRSALWSIYLFFGLALLFAIAAVIFFDRVNWAEILYYYNNFY